MIELLTLYSIIISKYLVQYKYYIQWRHNKKTFGEFGMLPKVARPQSGRAKFCRGCVKRGVPSHESRSSCKFVPLESYLNSPLRELNISVCMLKWKKLASDAVEPHLLFTVKLHSTIYSSYKDTHLHHAFGSSVAF